MPEKVIIQVEVPTKYFISCLLGNSFETWSWWQIKHYLDPYSWDSVPDDHDLPFITLGIDDPDFEEGEQVKIKILSVNDIVKAYGLYLQQSHCKESWENLDAATGDHVMQLAVLGEYTYG